MQSNLPIVKDLVLVGGGHSHVGVLRSFGMKPLPGVRVTLVSRDVITPYSGMLPGLIAGHYSFDDAHIDLVPLARFAGARFLRARVTGLALEQKQILCADRPPIPYDVLSLNIGSSPVLDVTLGASERAIPVKPIHQFLDKWLALKTRVADTAGNLRIGVVGAGAGGVELLLSVQHALQSLSANIEYHLITAGNDILSTHAPSMSVRFRRLLAERNVTVHTNMAVNQITDKSVISANGIQIDLDEILWVTQAGAAPWIGEAGLATDADGFMLVDDYLQSVSHAGVFGAGDVATQENYVRPKSGVFAVRQGPKLGRNLRRCCRQQPLLRFRPQQRFLSLISTGDQYAVGSKGTQTFEGRWVWRWKDHIDRRFMRKYQQLPDMPVVASKLPSGLVDSASLDALTDPMRCGGCGGKVSADVLTKVLNELNTVQRDDVVLGLDEADDAAVLTVAPGKLAVHSVDSFRPLVEDPIQFARIAANHALADLFAMGAQPQSALAIVNLPAWPEAKMVDMLHQLLTGALDIFDREGTALVGGHTGEASELSLGFSVTGLVDPNEIMRKGGLHPGDRLLLTKPVGTGVLFAADMRAKAKGAWIETAIASMVASHAQSTQCFARHGVIACTDITGFGVLGHLLEMLGHGDLDAVIDLEQLPILPGALECLEGGIVSSLQPRNERTLTAISNIDEVGRHPYLPLLVDPQTAGGMLAGVAPERAETCLQQLHELGYPEAAIIGTVVARTGSTVGVQIDL